MTVAFHLPADSQTALHKEDASKALAKGYFVESSDSCAVNQRICRMEPKRIDGTFLYDTLNGQPRLLAFDNGLNQTHLPKRGVMESLLCVPKDKHEQQRTTTCPSSLDALITAGTQLLEAPQIQNRGLNQQLFSMAEFNQ